MSIQRRTTFGSLRTPLGPVFRPEDYGAAGDLKLFTDGAIQSGASTLTSSAFSGATAGSKHIYVNYAGSGTSLGTLSGATGTSSITILSRTAGAASVVGPVVVSSGANSQLFDVSAGAGANANINVSTETPYFNFPIGSTLSYGNLGLSTTISSIAGSVATLAASASTTVQNMVGWFGTDDTAAFLAMLTALNAAGGGTILLSNKGYLIDGAPLTTRGGNAILPLPLLSKASITILGTAGTSSLSSEISYTNAEASGTTIATTRLSDTYSSSFGPPSMIGGPTYEATGNTNQYPQIGFFRLEDVTLLRPENPSIGGVDCSLVARTEHRRCFAKSAAQINRAAYNFQTNISSGYGAMGQIPSHAWNFGFWMPDAFNFGQSIASNCSCLGDYAGFVISAHTELDNCFTQFCTMSLGFNDLNGRSTGVHLNKLNRFGIFACNYHMGGWDPVNGIHSLATTAAIVTLEGELAVEADTNQWSQNAAPIMDVNGRIRGRLVGHNYSAFGDTKMITSGPGLVLKDADVAGLVPSTYDDLVLGETGLLSYYLLNDPSGATAKDATGRANGTLTATPVGGLQGPMGDASFKFDGSTNNVTLDTLSTVGANLATTTVEFLVNMGGAAGSGYLLGVIGGAAAPAMFIRPNFVGAGNVTGSTTFAINDNNSVNKRAGHITTQLYDGAWHHVIWNISTAGTHVIYIDGVPQTVTMDTTNTLGTMSNFDVGPDLGCVNLSGVGHISRTPCRMQRVAIYTTQLTQIKVQQHFQAILRTR